MALRYPSTVEEWKTAALMAADRRANPRPSQDQDSDGVKTTLDSETHGIVAELLVARILKAYPTALIGYDKTQPDIDGGPWKIEVRSTHHKDGHLMVRPQRDAGKSASMFILVTYDIWGGRRALYTVHGGMLGKDVAEGSIEKKGGKYWQENPFGTKGKPAWCVPQEDLIPFEDLLVRVQGEAA